MLGIALRWRTHARRSQNAETHKESSVADEKTIALNRRARHEFNIDETFEAGIVLTGTEIKSIRAGKVNLSDAYARIEKDEAWLIGAHIAPFEQANRYNHEPKRVRKLLLRRSEIDELLGRTKAKGQTIVPLRLYLTSKGRAKLELGLARGKNLYDRRRDIADRDARRDVAREMADAQRGR
jgi:SsrA-binding protein